MTPPRSWAHGIWNGEESIKSTVNRALEAYSKTQEEKSNKMEGNKTICDILGNKRVERCIVGGLPLCEKVHMCHSRVSWKEREIIIIVFKC